MQYKLNTAGFGESILLAVSGGVDSIVMAHLVVCHSALESVRDRRVAIAHCNFHLRGDESDTDASFVREWAGRHGVEYFEKDFDTVAFASTTGQSIEMAARELRYRWFDQLCLEQGFSGVCVAHNANDNAETMMLNLLRGTGINGVCAMSEVSVNPFGVTKVYRPILSLSRERILDIAEEHGESFRTDSSNLSSQYKRNRIRNEVFPLMRKINPSFIETFNGDIRRFRQLRGIVDDFVANAVPHVSQPRLDGGVDISVDALLGNAHWEYLLYSILSGYGFNSSVIEDMAELLKSDGILGGRRFGVPGFTLVTTSSTLSIVPDIPDTTPFRIEELQWNGNETVKTSRGVVLLDADRTDDIQRSHNGSERPLIRRWQDGDWLRPIGLGGKKKVSDLLTDLKYNVLEKENVCVVEGDGHHVLAVVGERIDESVRVTASSIRVYRISKE